MQKWEYTSMYIDAKKGTPNIEEKSLAALARLGEEGWELVTSAGIGMYSNILILKRPKP